MARKDSKLDELSRMWLFSACTRKELAVIGRATEETEVPAGKELTKEGATGHEFFLILDGEAAVKKNGRKVATLGPGQYFGELALLDRGPRNATVTAETPMKLLVIPQREFSAVLDEVPGMSHKLLRAMAERLRAADAKAVN